MLDEYTVKPIGKRLALDIVVEHHYLHRVCPVSKAFGLCDKDNDVYGVVTYGVPGFATPLLKGICGEDEMFNVYELNRLWIHPSMPKNAASYLVSRSLRMLDKEIIVSFADPSVGHVGYIYQATNFLYTGLSEASFKDPIVVGHEGQHPTTYTYGMTLDEVRDKFGSENITFKQRVAKHRYVFFNARGGRRKQLIGKLRYKVQPYPKGDTSHAYEDHGEPEHFQEQLRLF